MILLLLLLGMLGDIWTTSIGGAHNEANPLALLLMQHGLAMWVLAKLACNGALTAAWLLAQRRAPRSVAAALGLLVAVAATGQLLVTGHNL